jgi:hypothetical protein
MSVIVMNVVVMAEVSVVVQYQLQTPQLVSVILLHVVMAKVSVVQGLLQTPQSVSVILMHAAVMAEV